MHNVEYKCELRDPDLVRAVLKNAGATEIATLEQTDTYFKVATGRLKKREAPGEPTEYILYDRTNRLTPKLSHFAIYSEAAAIERFGAGPMPVWVVVKKTREVYLLGNVRIHLDAVENLGRFLEFEALVSRENNVAKCHEKLAELKALLGPGLGEPIAVSYSDLVAAELEQ